MQKDSIATSLPNLLREQVQARPDSEAIIYRDDYLTYRDLAEISSRLGSYLLHLGAETDECVGIFLEPSLELVAGIWGILFSGSAYLPLSPEYPEERLRYIIEDAGVKLVLSQETLRGRLTELLPPGTRIVTLEEAEKFEIPSITTQQNVLCKRLRSDNLAYVIYTSGSTGKPKGVMIEHRSIINQLNWMQTVCNLDQNKVVLQKTPMSFDAAQWEILASCCGSKIIMGYPGAYKNPEQLVEIITRHDVTTLQCVPTLLQALLDTDQLHHCQSLTQIFSGGEILSRKLVVQCLEVLPGCNLTNLYGPSECTINASAFKVDETAIANYPEAIPIGTPAHNTQFYILNDQRSLAQVEEIGELYIGGIQLARGYMNRPELTKERFINNRFSTNAEHSNLYKTGDLAYWNPDGTVQFVGRVDSQVKLRGFRIELDEVKLAIERHDWVKNAAVFVKKNSRTGYSDLIACIELSPKQAAVMDQGVHAEHHLSKKNKLQVKAQLSNLGHREIDDNSSKRVVDLPGKTPSPEQRRLAFARKSYRLFEGGAIQKADIVQLLDRSARTETSSLSGSRSLDTLSLTELGQILRHFGPFHSDERLLPKYGYASPGALYATQLYLELVNIAGLTSGYYYYHPGHHQLVLINEIESTERRQIRIHFIGKKQAIELVYKNNIQEVLQIETGHMLGLFDRILPTYQLGIGDPEDMPAVKDQMKCAAENYYLGTFALVPQIRSGSSELVDIYVQSHPGKIADLPAGQYKYNNGCLEKISDNLILKSHVIAINQLTYEQASFGITIIGRSSCKWADYIALGRKLQHLQMNDQNLGLLSSGYSSETGNDLPSAKRIAKILSDSHEELGPSYFCVGGRISDEQLISEGMKEDAVQMKGPVELLKEDLRNFLPDYMMPNKIVVIDQLPLTPNGKIDLKALEVSDKVNTEMTERPIIAPRTQTEQRIGEIWKKAMKWESVSVQDDFFESGGNSLLAVAIITNINKELQCTLPLHTIFEAPTIEKLAHQVGRAEDSSSSRLVCLLSTGTKPPVYCWPGLGGYPMNLRLLANTVDINRPFYGVQAYGINSGENPFSSIREMAAEDIKEIKRIQPTGPYTVWGYSFGARVAFEVAYQLEQSGDHVEQVFLIAPGSPKVRAETAALHGDQPVFDNKAYVTILFSVFSSSITGTALEECLKVAKDEDSFASFICSRYKNLDAELVKRIMRIVHQTYETKYTFRELVERRIAAPITIFKANGDDYSFIESHSGYSEKPATVINLRVDHYSMLKITGVSELVRAINWHLGVENKRKTEDRLQVVQNS
jgi:amino acid adenylation domain-containing protein